MWPFPKRPTFQGDLKSLTPEDLQVLAKGYDTQPEFFHFWLSLRKRRREVLEEIKIPKRPEDLSAYGYQCALIQREIQTLTRIIELPVTSAKALDRLKHQTDSEGPKTPQGEPWDNPEQEE